MPQKRNYSGTEVKRTIEQSAKRVKDAMEWCARTKQPITLYGGYGEMTAREACIAIGWDPWPQDWPKL